MELVQVMEMLCLVVTLILFITGLPPSLHMYRTGDTKNVPFLIFLLSILSCSGMLHYGYLQNNNTLILLNVVGTALNTLYVLMYLVVIPSKGGPFTFVTASIAYLFSLYAYLYQVLEHDEARANVLGGTASSISTLLQCLPILEIINNIRYKNADGMPLIMLIGALACGVCWLTYGLLLNDPNIYMPNIPGLSVTTTKLLMLQLYGGRKEKTN